MAENKLKPFDMPLTGRLRLDVDPVLLPSGDFQQLTNYRYTSSGITPVKGMSKINTAATNYTRIDNGFQFNKSSPVESHIIVQTTNAGGTLSRLVKSDNTTSPPSQDTFSTFLALAGTGLVNFSNAPEGCMVACDGLTNWLWGGQETKCVGLIVYISATSYYDYTDACQNTLTDAGNIATLHRDGTSIIFYVRSLRPIQGVTLYLGSVKNTAAATLKGYEWNGTAWAELTSGWSDGTSVGGTKTLGQNGKIAFASTVSTSKLTILYDVVAYYYRFETTTANADVTVTYCTLDAAPQPIVDIWDGSLREVSACFFYHTSAYQDVTLNILKEEYFSSDSFTYAQLGSMNQSDEYLYLGFETKQQGLVIVVPDGSYINTNAATMVIEYFNGSTWVDLGITTDSDGTFVTARTLRRSGKVLWKQTAAGVEVPVSINSSSRKYFYRVGVDGANLSADVRIDMIGGVAAQESIKAFSFSFLWQNRLWLGDEKSCRRNITKCSAYGTVDIWNGVESTVLNFGDNTPVVAASTMFTRYGGVLYDNAIVFKKNGVFLIDGTSPANYQVFTISDNTGIVAPLTLQKCDVSFETAPGITKHILMWQSSRGIEFFDGNTISIVSEDLHCFFDPGNSSYINTAIVDKFSSFYDDQNFEYHWKFATGTSTTLNKEYAFDLRRKKWFEVSRGASKTVRCGWTVKDPLGISHNYLGTEEGYIQRAENGTTFDTNAITKTAWTGDINHSGSLNYVSRLRNIKVTGISRAVAAGTLAVFKNTGSTAALTATITQNQTDRIYGVKKSCGLEGITHSYKLTDVEPLVLGGFLEPVVREDK